MTIEPLDLLPPNADEFAKALSRALDVTPLVHDGVEAIRGGKLVNPAPSWLPFLVHEYGLGPLSPYLPNLYELIDEGIDWQRVRGTPEALTRGLAFIGYGADIEEVPIRRRYWNQFHLKLDRLRDNERPDLKRIDGLTRLSVPERSYFWRGFHGYDIRAAEPGWTKYGECLLGDDSGVRIDDIAAKWSFGRDHVFSGTLTEGELTQLSVWQADTGSGALGWGNFSWVEAAAAWSDPASVARTRLMLTGLINRPLWFEFRDAGDTVIGYRRARYSRAVKAGVDGEYTFEGGDYTITADNPSYLLVEAQTDFGEGNGEIAASVGLVFDAVPNDLAAPGLLWVEPGALSNVTAPVAVQTGLSIDFSETVRERVQMRLAVT